MFPFHIADIKAPDNIANADLYKFLENVVDKYYVNSKNEEEKLATIAMLIGNMKPHMYDIDFTDVVNNLSNPTKELINMITTVRYINDYLTLSDKQHSLIEKYFPVTSKLLLNARNNVELNTLQNQTHYINIKNNWEQYCNEINMLSVVFSHDTDIRLSTTSYDYGQADGKFHPKRARGYKLFLCNHNLLHEEYILTNAIKFGKYPNLLNSTDLGLPSYTGLPIKSFYKLCENDINEITDFKNAISSSPSGIYPSNLFHYIKHNTTDPMKDKILSSVLENLEKNISTDNNKRTMIDMLNCFKAANLTPPYKINLNKVEIMDFCNKNYEKYLSHYILLNYEKLDQGFQFNNINFQTLLRASGQDVTQSLKVIERIWKQSSQSQQEDMTKTYINKLLKNKVSLQGGLIDFSTMELSSVEDKLFNTTIQNLILEYPSTCKVITANELTKISHTQQTCYLRDEIHDFVENIIAAQNNLNKVSDIIVDTLPAL